MDFNILLTNDYLLVNYFKNHLKREKEKESNLLSLLQFFFHKK